MFFENAIFKNSEKIQMYSEKLTNLFNTKKKIFNVYLLDSDYFLMTYGVCRGRKKGFFFVFHLVINSLVLLLCIMNFFNILKMVDVLKIIIPLRSI